MRHVFCTAILIALALPSIARADAVADALARAAVEAHDQGRYEDARQLLSALEERRPGARTLRAIAMCAIEMGDDLGAYRALVASLADERRPLAAEQRAHVEAMLSAVRARIAVLSDIPAGAALEVDGVPADPASDGTVPLSPGAHAVVIRSSNGAIERHPLELTAGRAQAIAVLVPSARILATDSSAALSIREHAGDPGLLHARARSTDAVLWTAGTLGAREGGRGFYGTGGLAVVAGALTRFTDELAVGGTLSVAWSSLLVAPSGSESATFWSVGLRLTLEVHPLRSPLAFVASVGGALGARAGIDGVTRIEAAVELEGGLRWFLVDELLFVGVDVRGLVGNYAAIDGALVVGLRT